MILTINTARTLITIESTLLDSFVAAPASYTNITITGYFNDTATGITETYTSAIPITAVTNVATNAGVETINPSFFSTTEFAQGVYRFYIVLISPTTIETDEGCIYVENGLKCNVDTYMLDETKTVNERVFAGLKYRALSSDVDCPCKCDNLIELYNNLNELLTNCKTC